jgi:hypothetical protein
MVWGSRFVLLHLAAIIAALLLTSCGDSTPTPVRGEGRRVGADLSVQAGNLPRASAPGQYEGILAPTDENHGEPLGALVPAQGGQKAQLEAKEKEQAAFAAAQARERAEPLKQVAKPAEPTATPPTQQRGNFSPDQALH